MSDTLRDCRLAGIHALVIVSEQAISRLPSPRPTYRIPKRPATRLTEENDDIYSYLPLFMSGPKAAKLPDRRAYFAARNWPFPEADSLFLAAINGDGKELGRLSLNVSKDQAAAKDVAAFIKTHLPKRRDARAGYEAALAEAKRTRRRVWVRVGQTRCGPCFSFSRWLDSQRELLAKDYVLFKID